MVETIEKVWQKIEKWLNIRPHSKLEIERYVKGRIKRWCEKIETLCKNPLDTFMILMDRIEKEGYINDENFARWWVQQRIDSEKFGSLRIKAELLSKGIDANIADEVIENYVLPVEKKLIRYHYKKLKNKYFSEEKIVQALLRKGFSYSLIQKAIPSLCYSEE
uniref:Regulatory protein RecX n=1 Tax=candidate division CPR3 bacterium TaxID=2268181 RepID=A0A7C5YZ00_UNCC3